MRATVQDHHDERWRAYALDFLSILTILEMHERVWGRPPDEGAAWPEVLAALKARAQHPTDPRGGRGPES